MSLTARQAQVLRLICKGLQNKQVAARLRVGESTVEDHRRRLMTLTRSGNAAQLGVWAERHGYTDSKPPSVSVKPSRDVTDAAVVAAAAGGAGS